MALVASVSLSAQHGFSKPLADRLTLLEGLGIEGDAHCGQTVKHRSRVAVDPTQPNLRQIHLIHEELFVELAAKGYAIRAGDLGENITTSGIDLLALPTGAMLTIGSAVIEITGLRNPCRQLDDFRPGLMKAVLDRAADGSLIRKAGIMGVVRSGGLVAPGDRIVITLPPEPHRPLERV
ncbi:MOSC domain-containing protein [Phreatobacter aquaticus]|uniref:MOSC domain-containing protein n=1 Tax=Phreatobacter aquaticus TaxID=2570229 RepID=A0A4D7QQH8_9HYPH|nr:MOSC domain-containing protein [Phreatobacter aquaticus]QCK87514.1 MOSC domain-containing protein [Phreatobacter aquaticus]